MPSELPSGNCAQLDIGTNKHLVFSAYSVPQQDAFGQGLFVGRHANGIIGIRIDDTEVRRYPYSSS